MNKVILIGRLGKDAEVTSFENGKKITKFSLATTEPYGNKETTWHNIDVWGDYGANLAQYLKKGGLVSIEGRISYNAYEAPDGTKKVFTSIVGERIELLDNKKDGVQTESTGSNYTAPSTPPSTRNSVENFSNDSSKDDDLPF